MIDPARIQKLNNLSLNKKGKYVLYWMQSSQRTEYNHALEYSIEKANELGYPLIIFFGLTDKFPEANERHYYFLLEGLKEVQPNLEKKGIKFIVQKISPEIGILDIAQEAVLCVVDRGYLTIEKQWRRYVAGKINCSFIQIETNVLVPIEEVSDKEEFGAYTLRPKITKKLNEFLQPLTERKIKIKSHDFNFKSLDVKNIGEIIQDLAIDHKIKRSDYFTGGISFAKRFLQNFISTNINDYEILRNDPSVDCQSNLSPYLHFGQISPLAIALEIMKNKENANESFLEQLIIRRELSANFVFYNSGYDNFQTLNLPNWARSTLEDHEKDRREYIYSFTDFEQAKTHDPYWNAAQNEMIYTGKMHNYMRMYWGKKILE
ncbi:MAG: deoxyribodipyrimidine photo-lyase [Candidatus Thorarchaeota archaeon]